eukprot:Skav223836  [mRNA]  locus=scaffold1256:194064:196363:- [translate_table: standard]
MSDTAGLREELQLLRADIDQLLSRVEHLERLLAEQSAPSGDLGPSAGYSSGSASRGRASAGDYTRRQREEAAAQTGRFFANCLTGGSRGASGRNEIKLQNRVWVLVRDIQGQVYTEPAGLKTKASEMASDEADPAQLLAEKAIIASDGDGTLLEFAVGTLEGPTGSHFDIVVIGKNSSGILVCVPGSAWDKKAGKRKLPQGCLTKPISVQVAGCTAEDRSKPVPEIYLSVWVGWLGLDQYPCVTFQESGIANDFQFEDQELGTPAYPFADGLLAIAHEKFGMVTVQNIEEEELLDVPNGAGDPVLEGQPETDRMGQMEAKMMGLEATLQELLQLQKGRVGDGGFVTGREDQSNVEAVGPRPGRNPARLLQKPQEGTVKQAAQNSGTEQERRTSGINYAGLDPTAVSQALQAGVPAEHIAAMSRVVQQKPVNMGDAPTASAALRRTAPDADSEPKELEVIQAAGGDPIVGSGSAEVGASVSRKHAAVVRALKRSFKEEPKRLWQIMEANMMEDFGLTTVAPNSATSAFSVRGWAEHRSRVLGYPRTVRAMWGVAGMIDCLRNNMLDEALCRGFLMMAQFEQESMDKGSYLLAQSFSLEPAPPLSSFQKHVVPEPTEMAYTHVMDSRWVEALAHHLKDIDSYMDMRKRLGQSQKGKDSTSSTQAPGAKAKAGAKAKSKGKGGKKGSDEAPAEEA